MWKIWESLYQAIIGAMVGFFAAGAVAYWQVRRTNLRAKTAQVLALEVQTRQELEYVVETTQCDRALLLVLHNGGGPLMGGAAKYASALHEAKVGRVASVLAEFQGFEVDAEYLMLMQQIEANRVVCLSTGAMRESMLKRRYEADGITAACVFKIAETPHRYYYASFTTVGAEEAFTSAANYARMEAAVNKLRRLYGEAKRGGYLA